MTDIIIYIYEILIFLNVNIYFIAFVNNKIHKLLKQTIGIESIFDR